MVILSNSFCSYQSDIWQLFSEDRSSAIQVSIVFFDLEWNYDFLYIYDGKHRLYYKSQFFKKHVQGNRPPTSILRLGCPIRWGWHRKALSNVNSVTKLELNIVNSNLFWMKFISMKYFLMCIISARYARCNLFMKQMGFALDKFQIHPICLI